MIKKIFLLILMLLNACGFASCRDITNTADSTDVTAQVKETEFMTTEQTDSDYIVSTDWMKFYFSKKGFKESDIVNIATESVSVMADVRNYLKVNYTLEKAEESVCYFDSTYRNKDGEKRSFCSWDEKEMHCISLDDFIHEYVHMISENNDDLVYHPSKLFSEGLAQYVSFNFYDEIATQQYNFFKEATVSENSNASEHRMICDLLSDNRLTYNAENYNKAFVAILDKKYDISKIDKTQIFTNIT